MEEQKKEFCTNSVINFLKEDTYFLNKYFELLSGTDNLPSYSGLLKTCKLCGTTKEHVDFESRLVIRSEVTKYMIQEYKEYCKDI